MLSENNDLVDPTLYVCFCGQSFFFLLWLLSFPSNVKHNLKTIVFACKIVLRINTLGTRILRTLIISIDMSFDSNGGHNFSVQSGMVEWSAPQLKTYFLPIKLFIHFLIKILQQNIQIVMLDVSCKRQIFYGDCTHATFI